jgi:hypothetical protein
MRAKSDALVQLKTGDAIKGLVSHTAFFWRNIKVEQAFGISVADPKTATDPVKMDGVIWIPKTNVSFIEQLFRLAE